MRNAIAEYGLCLSDRAEAQADAPLASSEQNMLRLDGLKHCKAYVADNTDGQDEESKEDELLEEETCRAFSALMLWGSILKPLEAPWGPQHFFHTHPK